MSSIGVSIPVANYRKMPVAAACARKAAGHIEYTEIYRDPPQGPTSNCEGHADASNMMVRRPGRTESKCKEIASYRADLQKLKLKAEFQPAPVTD